MKKDFLKQELKLGDKVVFMRVNYRDFAIGTIVSLGERKATIEHEIDNLCRTKTIQFYSQIIKYPTL